MQSCLIRPSHLKPTNGFGGTLEPYHTVAHVVAILPHADERLVLQFRFLRLFDNNAARITDLQEGDEIDNFVLGFNGQRIKLPPKVFRFHYFFHSFASILFKTLTCLCSKSNLAAELPYRLRLDGALLRAIERG